LVERALAGLSGVKRAEVSFTMKQAVVIYDPGKVQVERMVAAIQNAGFSTGVHQ